VRAVGCMQLARIGEVCVDVCCAFKYKSNGLCRLWVSSLPDSVSPVGLHAENMLLNKRLLGLDSFPADPLLVRAPMMKTAFDFCRILHVCVACSCSRSSRSLLLWAWSTVIKAIR
jgi:hypothetical protein